jgi:hypothetical protein
MPSQLHQPIAKHKQPKKGLFRPLPGEVCVRTGRFCLMVVALGEEMVDVRV